MTTVILKSTDKNFIFEFSFSPEDPLASPPVSLTPGETEIEDDTNTDVSTTTTVGTTPLTYLELAAYRQDIPELRFEWAGYLKENRRIPLQVPIPEIPVVIADKKTGTTKKQQTSPPEPDGNYCKGEFHLYLNSYTALRYVWFDLQFGEGYESTYEGCMIQFPVEEN